MKKRRRIRNIRKRGKKGGGPLSTGIIGGADGPTTIFISASSWVLPVIVIGAVVLIGGCIAAFVIHHRNS